MDEGTIQGKSAEKLTLPLARGNELQATKIKGPSLKNWILFFVCQFQRNTNQPITILGVVFQLFLISQDISESK